MAECIISGRQGPKGDTGAQGPQGATGSTGPKGTGLTCRRLTGSETITQPAKSFRFVSATADSYCYTKNMELLVNTCSVSQTYNLSKGYVISDVIYF